MDSLSQTCDSMSSPLECGDLPVVHANTGASFEPVHDAILALRERVEDLCNQELGKITKQGHSWETLLVFNLLPSALFSIMSSALFQSTTPPCSLWEPVSSLTLVLLKIAELVDASLSDFDFFWSHAAKGIGSKGNILKCESPER